MPSKESALAQIKDRYYWHCFLDWGDRRILIGYTRFWRGLHLNLELKRSDNCLQLRLIFIFRNITYILNTKYSSLSFKKYAKHIREDSNPGRVTLHSRLTLNCDLRETLIVVMSDRASNKVRRTVNNGELCRQMQKPDHLSTWTSKCQKSVLVNGEHWILSRRAHVCTSKTSKTKHKMNKNCCSILPDRFGSSGKILQNWQYTV